MFEIVFLYCHNFFIMSRSTVTHTETKTGEGVNVAQPPPVRPPRRRIVPALVGPIGHPEGAVHPEFAEPAGRGAAGDAPEPMPPRRRRIAPTFLGAVGGIGMPLIDQAFTQREGARQRRARHVAARTDRATRRQSAVRRIGTASRIRSVRQSFATRARIRRYYLQGRTTAIERMATQPSSPYFEVEHLDDSDEESVPQPVNTAASAPGRRPPTDPFPEVQVGDRTPERGEGSTAQESKFSGDAEPKELLEPDAWLEDWIYEDFSWRLPDDLASMWLGMIHEYRNSTSRSGEEGESKRVNLRMRLHAQWARALVRIIYYELIMAERSSGALTADEVVEFQREQENFARVDTALANLHGENSRRLF